MIARFVTLLPQPDSPTSPSRSPSSSSKLIPLTAWTVPSWVRNWTTRSSTWSRDGAAGAAAGAAPPSTAGTPAVIA